MGKKNLFRESIRNKTNPNYEELISNIKDLYINKNLSIDQIAEELDLSYGNTKWLKDYLGLFKTKEQIVQNRKSTCLERYGVDNPNKSEVIRSKTKQTNLERYGVENPFQAEVCKEKSKQTCLERYGTEYANQSEEVIKRIQATNLERYGNVCAMQGPEIQKKIQEDCYEKYGVYQYLQATEIRDKISKTNLERYGAENPWGSKEIHAKATASTQKTFKERYGPDVTCPMHIPEVVEARKSTCIKRYGVPFVLQSEEVQGKISETNLERYGVPYACMTDQCINASMNNISENNKRMAELFSNEELYTEFEYKIDNRSYDIFVPEYKLLVEIDPTYTHNSTVGPVFRGNQRSPIDPNYHLMKTELAKSNGFHCIHLFDWDWWEFVPKIYSLNKTTVYARKCEVKEITDYSITNEFLYNYHFQGRLRYDRSMISLGLYYNDQLISVMLFGNPRYNKNYQYELLRLCSDYNYKIVGGNQKLFKYFINNYNPESIISYCDRAKFKGEVYSKLGFNYKTSTGPTAHWYNYKNHYTDNLLRRLGADKLIGTNYGKGTNNEEIMIAHGYVKIYDCGQDVYEWRKEDL